MKKNRIVHISTSDLTVKYLLSHQLRRLTQLGYDTLAISSIGDFSAELGRAPFNYVSTPIKRKIAPLADLSSLTSLTRFFKQNKLDLVHTHTNKAGILGCWAAHLAGVKHIVSTVHGFYFHEFMNPVLKSFFIQLYRFTFQPVEKIFMQSREDIATAVTTGIAPENNCIHIGNGIDLSRFDPENPATVRQGKKLRQSLELRADEHLIGLVARINQEKGIRELLEAVRALIYNHDRKVRLVVIGDGPARGEFEDMARSFGIDRQVHFAGVRDDIPAWLLAMDVFVLPSYREGFPRTLCEAFAMGTPAVASRIRGCRELIDHNQTGLLVPPRNASELTEAIASLLADPVKGRTMAGSARRYALDHLDEERVIDLIHQTYLALGLAPDFQSLAKQPGSNTADNSHMNTDNTGQPVRLEQPPSSRRIDTVIEGQPS